MNRVSALATALVLALGWGTVSYAGELDDVSPLWTGFYVGLDVGGSGHSVDFERDVGGGYGHVGYLGQVRPDVGVFGGYTVQFAPGGVAGVELAYNLLHAPAYQEDRTDPMVAWTPSIMVERSLMASGRAGFLVTPHTLFYGKAGLGMIEVDAPEAYWFNSADTKWLKAIELGLGLETQITPRASVRTEVSYTTAVDSMKLQEVATTFDQYTPSYVSARLGFAYHFDQPKTWPTAEADAMMRPVNWTGLNIGASVGASAGGSIHGFYYHPPPDEGPFSEIQPVYGGWVGLDWQSPNNMVFGVEVGGDWLGQTNTRAVAGDEVFGRYPWMANASGRFGFLLTPSTLLYGKAGVAMIHTEASSEIFGSDATSANLIGVQTGAGIETMLMPNVGLRVEGLMTMATDKLWINFGGTPDTDYIQPRFLTGKVGLALHL